MLLNVVWQRYVKPCQMPLIIIKKISNLKIHVMNVNCINMVAQWAKIGPWGVPKGRLPISNLRIEFHTGELAPE